LYSNSSDRAWYRGSPLYIHLLEALSPLAETLQSVNLQFGSDRDGHSTDALISSITPFRELKVLGITYRVRASSSLLFGLVGACPQLRGLLIHLAGGTTEEDVIRFEDDVSKGHIPTSLRKVRLCCGCLDGLDASGWVHTDQSTPQDAGSLKRTYRKGSIEVVAQCMDYQDKERVMAQLMDYRDKGRSFEVLDKERAFEELESEVLLG
jgi:hypothetical protein